MSKLLFSALLPALFPLIGFSEELSPLRMKIDRTTNGSKGAFSLCANMPYGSSPCTPIGVMNLKGVFAPSLASVTASDPSTASRSNLSDAAPLSTQNSPADAMTIYSPITPRGFYYYDTDRAVAIVPPNSKFVNTSAKSCYLLDHSALSVSVIAGATQTVGAGVCNWGIAIAAATGAAVWGDAQYISDTPNNAIDPKNTTGRGLIGTEKDFQANAVDGAGKPSTTAAGVHLLFGGKYLNATGFTVGSRGAQNVDEAFTVADGAMKPGAYAHIVGIAANPSGNIGIGSQVSRFDWWDGTRRQSWTHAVQPDGGLLWTSTTQSVPFRINAPLYVIGDEYASRHFVSQTTIHTPTNCGTSASATGTDHGGSFTFGSGAVTSCTITYGQRWPTNAWPTVTPRSNLGAVTYYISAQSPIGFVVTLSAPSPGASFNYNVNGN